MSPLLFEKSRKSHGHIRRRITSVGGPPGRGNSDAAGAPRPPALDKLRRK